MQCHKQYRWEEEDELQLAIKHQILVPFSVQEAGKIYQKEIKTKTIIKLNMTVSLATQRFNAQG